MRIVVRGPNHLGDGVMAMPALEALARVGEVVVHAPRWGPELYRDLPVAVRPLAPRLERGDVALLFAPSLRAAREAWSCCPRRVGVASDLRGPLLTDRVRPAPHTAETYARLVEVVGARVDGVPRYRLRDDDPVPDVPEGHLALNPLSATPATREWEGWDRLALGAHDAVFYGGPGEHARLLDRARGHRTCVGLSLPALGRALRRARVMVSADTGPAHFARAVGVPTVVIYGSTAPWGSGPAGSVAVEGHAPCRPCGKARCRPPRGVAPRACLHIEVDRVQLALEALGG